MYGFRGLVDSDVHKYKIQVLKIQKYTWMSLNGKRKLGTYSKPTITVLSNRFKRMSQNLFNSLLVGFHAPVHINLRVIYLYTTLVLFMFCIFRKGIFLFLMQI